MLFLRDASRLDEIDDPGNTMLRRTRSVLSNETLRRPTK